MTNVRIIYALHPQFELSKDDPIGLLYELIDKLDHHFNGDDYGFEYAGSVAPYSVALVNQHQALLDRGGHKNPLLAKLSPKVCLVVEMDDGMVHQFGFPDVRPGYLRFPTIKAHRIDDAFRQTFKGIARV